MIDERDFSDFPKVRITDRLLPAGDPPHPQLGCTGQVQLLYHAEQGWPSDLLYVLLLDGPKCGQVIRVFAHRCDPIPESEAIP